jgi:hypothetical protein
MHKRDWVAVGSWLGIAAGLWIIAWIISAAIPVFSNLLSLIVGSCLRDKALSVANTLLFQTALFASWFSYCLGGVFWLYINKGRLTSSLRMIIFSVINLVLIGIGLTIVCCSLLGVGVRCC